MEMPTDLSDVSQADHTRGGALRDYAELARHHDPRLSRALDYLAHSLESEDSLQANVGSVNSGLIIVAQYVEEAIVAAMGSGPPDVKRLVELKPAIDTQLRLAAQIGRFANFELRAAEARQPKTKEGAPITHGAEVPSAPASNQSEDSAN